MHGAWVQPLVGELRSHVPCGTAKIIIIIIIIIIKGKEKLAKDRNLGFFNI